MCWPVYDFPDIRYKVAIQSAGAGNLLIIPREGELPRAALCRDSGRLGRDERAAEARHHRRAALIATAQHPASLCLDVKEVAWWSVYEISPAHLRQV